MCFPLQRRTLFRHLDVQRWSEHVVLLIFSLGNVLPATTACTFSTSQLPKVVWRWCALYILTWEMCFAPQRRALFRHLNFQKWSGREGFLAFLLLNAFRTTTACNFLSFIWPDGSAPAPRPSGATNHWKNTHWIVTFLPFHAPHLLSSYSFSSLIFSLLFFYSLTLPTSAFPSVHIVGILTSKLPSAIKSFVFASLLPAPLLPYVPSLLSLCLSFSFAFFSPVCILNETLERPLVKPKETVKKSW